MTDEKITIEVANDLLRVNIRENYTQVANASNEGACCGVEASCCGVSDDQAINQLISTRLGYTVEELAAVPEGADMGLGCGNPKVIAALQLGEVVIDLGSGGGFDCFLAANEVGESGKVIGVDMTPDMLSKARANAERGRYAQVEFRLGEIENLPVADNTADVVMSNCVINLSPHKPRVFEEIFRVLKPGGRIAVSDVVATQPLPDEMKNDPFLISACVGGAALIDDLEQWMQAAGFAQIVIEPKDESKEFIRDWAPSLSVEDYVVSAAIQGVKP